jgi:hypothetical protein
MGLPYDQRKYKRANRFQGQIETKHVAGRSTILSHKLKAKTRALSLHWIHMLWSYDMVDTTAGWG